MAIFWLIVAVTGSFAGYLLYLAGIRRDLIQPNRASWLIWSAATAVEALTYGAVNPGEPQAFIFYASAFACVLVTAGVWKGSEWSPPTAHELFCISVCLASLVVWLAFREAFWAHMLVVAAVPISFWPTWVSAWEDSRRERSPAWGLWTMGDLATLLVALPHASNGIGEIGYVFVELACHASVWFLVGLATINPIRSLGFGRNRLRILDAPRPASAMFRVGENQLGKAVYASEGFEEGEVIVEFTGRRFRADKIPSLMRGRSDRFVQVTPQHYMGPSGRIDDLINHSCDPNGGLRFASDGVFLIAIRDIAAGEEIAWDYSTTLTQSNWHMICQCKAENCRRVIGNFETLSPERQEWFRGRNLVAPYLRRRDKNEAAA